MEQSSPDKSPWIGTINLSYAVPADALEGGTVSLLITMNNRNSIWSPSADALDALDAVGVAKGNSPHQAGPKKILLTRQDRV